MTGWLNWAALHSESCKLVHWQYAVFFLVLLGGNAPFKIISFPFRVLYVYTQLHCLCVFAK